MANDLNQCNFTGRLGRDPEVRRTTGGTAVANFSIAVGGKKKVGDAWEDTTEWVPVVLWGRLAEIAGEYLKKGSQVRVTGKFTTRSWDQDGATKYKSEIVAFEMQMLGRAGNDSGGSSQQHPDEGRRSGGYAGGQYQKPAERRGGQSRGVPPDEFDDIHDDIPF